MYKKAKNERKEKLKLWNYYYIPKLIIARKIYIMLLSIYINFIFQILKLIEIFEI